MATLVQSLSWALVQSFVQGILVYMTISVLLWAIPASRSRLRYSLSLFSMLILSLGFIISCWREFEVLRVIKDAPIATLTATSLSVSTTRAVSSTFPLFFGSGFFHLLGSAYIVGVLLMSVRLFIGVRHIVKLRDMGIGVIPDSVEIMFRELKSKVAVTHPVKLLVSVRAHVPMVVGVFKPVILLPVSALAKLDAGQLETILIHELAHVKRYDYLANVAQAAIETMLFFNPFVWLISSVVRDEREHCCDDIVVRMVNNPLDYAEALTAVAGNSRGERSFAVAATGRSGSLFARVQRITEGQDLRLNYSRFMAGIALLLAIAVSVAWAKPSFRHKTKRSEAKVANSKLTGPSGSRTLVADSSVSDGTGKSGAAIKYRNKQQLADTSKLLGSAMKPTVASTEENVLVNRLLQDRVVDQVKGFLVERHFKDLYINSQLLPADISSKYLQGLNKDIIRVQVFPMEERMRMHPDADFIQLLLPFTFESPCVQMPGTKEGC